MRFAVSYIRTACFVLRPRQLALGFWWGVGVLLCLLAASPAQAQFDTDDPTPAPADTTKKPTSKPGAKDVTTIKKDTVDTRGKYVPSSRPTFIYRDRYGDPFSNRDDVPPMLDKAGSQQTSVELDTNTNQYVVKEKMGNMDYRPESNMTFDEYQRYQQRENMKSFVKQKVDNQAGQGPLSNNRLIPKIYLNPALDRLFGGNFVDIKPNGSVILDFGMQSQRVYNPALPIRQQRNTQFLFDQQISVNLQGKVGEKLKITVNYDTKASFDFENQVKVEYNGLDHEILKKIEAGNVSLPVSSSLITGAQNLFGVKTTMQFGRLKVVSVASTQRGKSDKLVVKGGAQTKDISIRVDQYEANRHFFLSQFFRNNYERALQRTEINPPASGVIINRVEVYITNRANNTQTLRNMVAFIDVGEGFPYQPRWRIGNRDSLTPSANAVNNLFTQVKTDENVRNADLTRQTLVQAPYNLTLGTDFELIRGARRLAERDFVFHRQLGYISLNTPLRDDEVLAVAYEYSYNGQVFKVGELTEEYQNLAANEVVVLKLLRPSTIQTRLPTWNLQMKNIYSLGASQVSREGFQLRVIYRDDSSGVDNPVLRQGRRIRDRQLMAVMNMDRLNAGGEVGPDGNFDFIDGTTIDTRNGRIIFPVLEPFGTHLRRQFDEPTPGNPREQAYIDKYVFQELYTSTQQDALQAANKAKFFIQGKMQSAVGSEISLPGVNIAPGSVRVNAGITQLVEGQHYTVDYTLGKVRIIDQGVLASGQQVEISYEKSDLFNFQQKTFFGSRLDYVISPDISLGGTLLYLNERPLIRRTAVGDEPVTNVLWGLDVNYRKDSRTLTKLVDLLPMIQTKETSSITFSGEYAMLMPGANAFVDPSGKGVSYLDDFEGVRTTTDLTNQPMFWRFASTPIALRQPSLGFTEANPLSINFKRARLAWYVIDNIFYRQSGGAKPGNISATDLENNYVRPIGPQEVFPNRDLSAVNFNQTSFDLAYYPNERGQYNYSTLLNRDGTLRDPRTNWGGVMRPITINTDFDAANIEYVEFWMMDPFISGRTGAIGGNDNGSLRRGELIFDFGTISEDVMRDGRHSFENGLPTPSQRPTIEQTAWGNVTTQQFLTNAFDNNPGSRAAQDIGLDGMNDETERTFFSQTAPNSNNYNYLASIRDLAARGDLSPEALAEIESDPSNDNFQYFLGDNLDQADAKILERYKRFNGMQGNSPEAGSGLYTPSNYPTPDNEDLNGDNTVNDIDAYYSYRINVTENDFATAGRNYIVDILRSNAGTNWYLFRIPLRDLNHPNFAGATGNIGDFKSIRFMRAYLTGFEVPTVVRMVQFQLVASTWRPYPKPLPPDRVFFEDEDDAAMTVGTVNIEENGFNAPGKVPYVIPPGIARDRDVTSGINRRLNEQSLSLCVERLRPDNAKAVFKNVRFDFLNYRRLRMFISAYSPDNSVADGHVSAFIRLGTDFTENFYEVEIPLKMVRTGETNPSVIWAPENELNIEFADLYSSKLNRIFAGLPNTASSVPRQIPGTNQIVRVVGNPDMNNVNVVMLGVRHTERSDRRPKNLCLWFNELRVTDFEKNQGWATTGRLAFKLADLGNVTMTGRYVAAGFGGIEQKISERTRDNTYSYNISANITLDKFLPKKAGLRVPMYVSYERSVIDPKYDPLNPDIPVEASLRGITDPKRRDEYRNMVMDQTTRRSINFTNVQRVKTGKDSKIYPWDIENLNFTYSYSEMLRTNINTESYLSRNWRYGVGYSYSGSGITFEPFKSAKGMKSPWLKFIKDFNLSFMPSTISARADLDRSLIRTQLRSADVFGPLTIAPTFEKAFFMNRTYGLRYAPFKSLTFDYSATVNAIIDEPFGDVNTQAKRDTIRNNLLKLGRMKNFNQNIRANWRLPLDKFPVTDWMTADLTYSAGYIWTASPLALQDTLGNTIQNTRERAINGRFDLLKLYNKSKWLKEINTPKPPAKKPTSPAGGMPKPPEPKKDPKKDTTEEPREYKGLKVLARALMSLRNINLSYTVSEGTTLPGYRPDVNYLGYNEFLSSPGWDFILGEQNIGINTRAAANGWLGRSRLQNQLYSQNLSENLNVRASLEPLNDFRLQLDATMRNTATYSELFRDTLGWQSPNPVWASLNPTRSGSYSVSWVSLPTAFDTDDAENRSSAFKRFEEYRYIIRSRLEARNPARDGAERFRYDNNSQDVLIPSFIAAYSGQDPRSSKMTAFPRIPLPNWRVDYSGLTKIPFLERMFQAINVTHAYTGNYSVASYTTNLQYGSDYIGLRTRPWDTPLPNRTTASAGGDSVFTPVYNIQQVVITEKFAPLIGFNFRLKNKITLKIDYNRERNAALNMSNAQITELRAQDVTFGFGWAKSGVKLPFTVRGETIVLKNELQTRCDITLRETVTIQRKIDDINTITQGMQDIQIKPSINYMINQRLNIQFYVEYTTNTPKISTSFRRTATRGGFQLRFSLM